MGIPMGTNCAPLLATNCAPLLANLFLFYYEYKYIKNPIKNNIILAKKFNNTMRYIDDLLTLNNNQFDAAIKDIISSRTSVKKTTENATALSYLDVLIKIDSGIYSTAVFDKRDSSTFNIVNFPHLSSYIPSKLAYVVYIFQLVRIARICSNFVQFKPRSNTVIIFRRTYKNSEWDIFNCGF